MHHHGRRLPGVHVRRRAEAPTAGNPAAHPDPGPAALPQGEAPISVSAVCTFYAHDYHAMILLRKFQMKMSDSTIKAALNLFHPIFWHAVTVSITS